MSPSLKILVAGPYRSGTGDDPARMAANSVAWRTWTAVTPRGSPRR